MSQKYHFKNQNIRFHNDLLILHINTNKVELLFGCSTGGLVSYLSPAYGGSAVTINIATFFKEENRMTDKNSTKRQENIL